MTTIASLKPNQSFLRRLGSPTPIFVFRSSKETTVNMPYETKFVELTLLNLETLTEEKFLENETLFGFDLLTDMRYKETDAFRANNTERAVDLIGRPILKESVMDLAILVGANDIWSAQGELVLVGVNVRLDDHVSDTFIYYTFKDAEGAKFTLGGSEAELTDTSLYPYRQKATRYTPWALANKSSPRIPA